MSMRLDSEQQRILNWRMNNSGIAACIGPPGCGKTTTGSMLAVSLIAEGLSEKILLVAYTNAAVNEFGWEISKILGPTCTRNYCIRTGNQAGMDPNLPIAFSNDAEDIRRKQIVLCTTLSLKRISSFMRFDNMIIDEAGIERLEHLLSPFVLGVSQLGGLSNYKKNYSIENIIDLASNCGVIATVIGDPKQSRPMGLNEPDRSAIEWVLKYSQSDTLKETHRLPDMLSGLVNDFALYGGLRSSPDIAFRRLNLENLPRPIYREILDPEVITWVNVNGDEKALGEGSWANEMEAKLCAKLCIELRSVTKKSISIITRFSQQKRIITRYIQRAGLLNIKVSTTTGALGTEADIVLFSLVRNNKDRIVGQAGTLQDLNVAISRAKEKLIIVGNFRTMENGYAFFECSSGRARKSHSRRLAKLIGSKYGKVIDSPFSTYG